MLNRNRFIRLADGDDVDARTVERDYVLTHVLTAITRQDGNQTMAFKGGTALRLCFFQDYRYSADLDFSLTDGMTRAEAVGLVTAATASVAEQLGFAHLAVTPDGSRIEFEGPLGGKMRDLKLDLADDELVLK